MTGMENFDELVVIVNKLSDLSRKFTAEDDLELIEITKSNALITLTAVKVEKMQNNNKPFNNVYEKMEEKLTDTISNFDRVISSKKNK